MTRVRREMERAAPRTRTRRALHPTRTPFLFVAIAALVMAACGAGSGPGPSGSPGPGASASPGPGTSGSPGATLTTGELRLALIDRFGPRWYCDPDEYPVPVADEQTRAIERFAAVQAEGDTYRAVLDRLGLAGATTFSDARKLAIYHLWKVAVSLRLDPIGNGTYRFDYLAQPVGGAAEGTRSGGTISGTGVIVVEQAAPAGEPMCPICLARGSLIDTPNGPVAVDRLQLGDPIWTLDADGRRVAGVIIAVGSTPAPAGHHVVEISLADGRTVTASPGHPLADGRAVGDLRVGDELDGSRVVSALSRLYDGDETFDIVASGPTGAYFVDGIPMGSTLRP
jgi:hypothetical protein